MGLTTLTMLTGGWSRRSGWSALGEHTCQIRQNRQKGLRDGHGQGFCRFWARMSRHRLGMVCLAA
jgi:hypothetical protein